MTFPIYIHLGPVGLHPHWLFESLAYAVGFRLYLWRRRRTGDHLSDVNRWWVVVAAMVGAAAGSKLLYWLSDPWLTLARWNDPAFLLGGKSIVGALAGGLLAVEWAKMRLGVTRSTGDLFAIPLAAGTAIGRIGCFLTGLDDHTHGLPTTLLLGVDFGDGVRRHPAQLYEMVFLALLIPVLAHLARRPHRHGDVFKTFMIAYLGFRLLLEGIKPGVPLLGLNAIQWVCAVTLTYYALHFGRRALRLRREDSPGQPQEVFARG
ncbi:MAG: prolipoprotein diacylglyceryl transferase [Chloroflexota bacterium]